MSINAHSDVPPSDVEYAVRPRGHQPLASGSRSSNRAGAALRPGEGLDYVRGGICKPEHFKPLPLVKPGAEQRPQRALRHATSRSAATRPRVRRAAGAPDSRRAASTTCTRTRATSAATADDDGVWQDGGLLVQTGANWTAILLRFQSQSWRTDDAHRPRTLIQRSAMPKPPLPDELEALLASPRRRDRHAASRTARPLSVATWYLWEDGRVLVNLDHTPRPARATCASDPRVSLTVLDADDWYRHVSLRGRVSPRSSPTTGLQRHRPDLPPLPRRGRTATATARAFERLGRGRTRWHAWRASVLAQDGGHGQARRQRGPAAR